MISKERGLISSNHIDLAFPPSERPSSPSFGDPHHSVDLSLTPEERQRSGRNPFYFPDKNSHFFPPESLAVNINPPKTPPEYLDRFPLLTKFRALLKRAGFKQV